MTQLTVETCCPTCGAPARYLKIPHPDGESTTIALPPGAFGGRWYHDVVPAAHPLSGLLPQVGVGTEGRVGDAESDGMPLREAGEASVPPSVSRGTGAGAPREAIRRLAMRVLQSDSYAEHRADVDEVLAWARVAADARISRAALSRETEI